MLKRKITKILEEWKREENKQCLLIRGARQVGKTFIIEQFCKKNYESYIYINFDLSPTLKNIFDGDLDANTLIMKLEVTFPEIEIKPGKTILFLHRLFGIIARRNKFGLSMHLLQLHMVMAGKDLMIKETLICFVH